MTGNGRTEELIAWGCGTGIADGPRPALAWSLYPYRICLTVKLNAPTAPGISDEGPKLKWPACAGMNVSTSAKVVLPSPPVKNETHAVY
jgi:hypothetical protein